MSVKNSNKIKKIRTAIPAFYLIIQILFLNGFTIYMSCFNECCHTSNAISSCCCSGCGMGETEKEASAAASGIEGNCHCFHAENNSDNYMAESQFKIVVHANEFEAVSDSKKSPYWDRHFPKENDLKFHDNSPPIYLSNSVFLI